MPDEQEAIDLVLSRLDGVRKLGGYWMARCPAHEDQRASLSVARGTEQPVVLKCHAGCEHDDILSALRLTPADISKPREEPGGEWTPYGDAVAIYDYTDEEGALLFQVCRTASKQFPQRRRDASRPSGWAWKLGEVRRVPYRLPRVLAAIRDGEPVWIVEGEKDVHALEAAGVVATCNPGGAGKWRDEYAEIFRGAAVAIIADADAPGREHAAAVARSLEDVAAAVDVRESATGKDVSDHLAAGNRLGDLRNFVVTEEPHANGDGNRMALLAAKFTSVNWHEAWGDQPSEIQWLRYPILEEGTLNALFSKPGVGKSLLALELVLELVRGGRTVVYVDDENRIVDLVERLQAFGAVPGELDRLLLYSFAGLPALDNPAGGEHLEALAVTAGAALVVLDTTTRMVAGHENDADTFLQLYRCSLVPLKARNITVLRLDHPGKDEGRGQRGSSAKDGDVDTVWRLTPTSNPLELKLYRAKSRSGHSVADTWNLRRRSEPLRHEWTCPDASRIDDLAGQLDRLGMPSDAGRVRCRAALKAAGIPAGGPLLEDTIRARRAALGRSGAVGQSSTRPANCPPTPHSGVGSGQVHAPALFDDMDADPW